jgi:hypothetical protein
MKAWIGALLALAMAPCAMAQQVKPACTDNSRQCMITAATSYLEGLVHHDGSKVLLALNVTRSEQGHVNTHDEASLRKSLDHEPAMVGYSNLRFVVDTETHQLVYYTLLGLSMRADQAPAGTPPGPVTVHLAERFKVEHGLITEIEALFYNQPNTADGVSGWPD